jgi:protein ImuB
MFAAIHLPSFCVQAVLRWREEMWARAVVVVDPESGLVAGRTLPAGARGIEIGMTAAQAMARAEKLTVLPRSAMQERTIDAVLIETALRHSPFVEQTSPGLATLDLRGIHPKIGWHGLGDQMVAHLKSVGLRSCVAMGKNPDVVRLAAQEADPVSVVRNTGEFLHPLPLAFLSPPADVLAVLRDWGVTTIGEFLALPAQETIDRLGPDVRRMWLLASGRSRRPLRLVKIPETFEESCDLGYAVETAEPLLFLLRRFADQLSMRLRASYFVASRMTLRLPLDDRGIYERVFSIPEPTADPDVLFRILSTHIEALTLEEKPVGIALVVDPAKPTSQQFGLFGTTLRDPNRFGETLARIGAIVDIENIGFPEIENTHRADAVRLLGRVNWTLEDAPSINSPRLGLPLRRCRPPVPARVSVRQRCPSEISSAVVSGRIRAALGPYRLSGDWWEAGAWHSEEWDVDIGRVGLFRLAKAGDVWRVEGCYDSVC